MDHKEHRTNVSGPSGLEHSVGEIKRGRAEAENTEGRSPVLQ